MTTLRPELPDELLANYETPGDLLGDDGNQAPVSGNPQRRRPLATTH